ncbi:MAG: efflux transporter outer membrane subunit [Acidobacteria bacterium]|nr:efflux transporter outer membrane subunit [Acidobacteriota bacterium]
MRSITDIFIRRPVLAVVVNLVLVLVGLRAVAGLPLQQFPQLDSSSLLITTTYYGASAETVRGFLTTPIERVVSAIGGIDHLESSSRAGVSVVTVRLKLNYDPTAALAEVNARLQQVRAELPAEAEPPIIEVQRADRPYASFYVSFSSPDRGVPEVTDYLMRHVQPQLSTLEGVQRITIEGGRQLAMRVWIDANRLAALGLSPGDVYAALRRNNYLAAVGQAKGEQVQVNLLANTDLRSVPEFESLIVSERADAVVRLRDVARVELGAEEPDMVAKYNGTEGVYLGIWPLVGSNEIEVARRLRAEMERLRPTLPADMDMRLVWDGTMFMRNALEEISKTLVETVLIVGVVVFLFVGSVRTALVPLVAMPISLIGTAAIMAAFGFSLNLLTILAVVLAVGLVVDDAIVVVENVERHVRSGKTPVEAALAGARELVGPIIAMTVTLAAVYTPIAFQGGLTGSLFLEFAITLAAAVVLSGVVAVTLSPVMSARFVDPNGREARLTSLVNRGFDRVRAAYARMLDGALEIRGAIVAAALIVAVAAWPLYSYSRSELAPVEDQSHITMFFQASPDASLPSVNRDSRDVVAAVTALPEAEFMWSLTASWGGVGGLVARDWRERQRSTEEMYGQVFGAVSQVPGLRVFPRLDPPLPTPGQYDVELVLQSAAPAEQMLEATSAVLQAGWQSGKFLYVDTDLKIDLPEARVVLDRQRIADLGLDLSGVAQELGTLFGGRYVNHFNYYDRSYKVIPQIGEEDRASVAPLLDLKVRTPGGALVPVSTFARVETSTAPRVLNRFQQQNAVRVFGGVKPGVTKEEGLRVLEAAAAAAPGPRLTIDHAGESRQIRREASALTLTLGFAVILIYLVLAAQFHSFRDPLIVLLGSVPLATSGALLVTFLDLTTINIYSQVGLITLVGLVAKNGILIVEFANTLQERGLEKIAAIREASLTRLRPVLMTSAATVLGHFPLVLVTGPGAEARNSIGMVLVTGMTIGTIFTLFVVPVFYALLAARHAPASEAAVDRAPGLGARAALAGARVSVVVLAAALLAGCAVRRPYEAPRTEPPVLKRVDPALFTSKAYDARWWREFNDPTLTELEEAALASNVDLRVAAARVDQARAIFDETKLDRFPRVTVGGSVERREQAFPGFTEGRVRATTYRAGFEAFWEADVFGAVRSGIHAAEASAEAAQASLADVQVIVAADVARRYFELRGLQHQLAVGERSLANQRETLRLTEARRIAGVGEDQDVASAAARVAAVEASLPPIRAAIAEREHALAVLAGQRPGELAIDLSRRAYPPLAKALPIGEVSDLLRRRPDVRRAERALAAATARESVAAADLFPRISLSGFLGLLAGRGSMFGSADSRAWAVAPALSWAGFDLGSARARLRGAEAGTVEALAAYEQAVLRAIEETENALVAYRTRQERLVRLMDQVRESTRAASIARVRYREGLADFLELLDAERVQLDAEQGVATAEADVLTGVVSVYRALGGVTP